MNENIKNLWDAALEEFSKQHQFATIMLPEPLKEKFARLIVAECMNICNQAILQNQDTLSKLGVDELAEKMIIHGSINQAQKLGKGIKEHFGVEE